MPIPRPIRRFAAAALLAAPAAPLAAQAPPVPGLVDPYRQSIAVNAIALPFALFSAEYEAALPTPGFTLGVGGSWLTTGDDRDSWAEVKALYYPGERQFRGFSIGLTAGVHSARNDNGQFSDLDGLGRRPTRTQTGPTAGVLVSYDWLLGRAQRFRVGTGLGAKRVLRDIRDNDPLLQVYPDGRFVIGVAF